MKKPQHILIIRLSAMGDVAMTMPVVYAFAKAYPETTITFLSKPFLEPIIMSVPNVRFIAAETQGTHKGILGLWKLARELKAMGITQIADLHNVTRSKILKRFLGLPSASIDKGRKEKKAITRAVNKNFAPLKTTIARYVSVFEELGFKGIQPEVLPKAVSNDTVLQFTSLDTKKWIGIAPFAAHQGKQYPLDLMREVLGQLDKQVDLRLFLFGAPSEKDALVELSKGCDSCTIVAGSLSFTEELNLIQQLDGMLSMDSGNGHLAALFGIPTVTLWGVTHPYAGFAPFEQEAHCVLSDRELYPLIPTSVYGNKVPDGYDEVMRSIAPDDVVSEIEKSVFITTAQKILHNKPNYRRNLEFLDSKYNGRFSNLLKEKQNDINVLSLFAEMEFGYLLNQLFSEVVYEPELERKKPDWLVTSGGQKIIFEVKKINPPNKELNERIDLFKADEYLGNEQDIYVTSIDDFWKQLSKITDKEKKHRDLITKHNYILIICIDVISLHKDYITDKDLRDYLNFEDSPLFDSYPEFLENVAGIIGKPKFGNLVYIENTHSKYGLNKENMEILNKIGWP